MLALAEPADCPLSVLSHNRLTELLFPRGIRRSRFRAEVRLFAEYLWLRAGCCHRVIDFHPNECYPIGFIDPRTSEKLLAEVIKIGWAAEIDGRRGRRRPIILTPCVWEVGRDDMRQGSLFDAPPDIPPEAVGRDPRLVMPHLLPLALWEDESIDPSHKLVGWFLLLETGLQSWEATFHVATVAKELGRHPKQIRDSLKRLDGQYWQLLDSPNGFGRLRFSPRLYLPNQPDEARLVANGQASIAVGYLPLYPEDNGAHGAPISGASYAYGAPIGGTPVADGMGASCAHGAPISGASYAHGAPIGGTPVADGMGASCAHGAPISGASCAHGAPISAPILSSSESNLITSDQMKIQIQQIERRARKLTEQLSSCAGMKAFMPILFSVLVELGELDEQTLWENVKGANASREPPKYLTGTIKRQVCQNHTSEAYAREVFPRFGILWTSDLTGEVVKPRTPRKQDRTEERETLRQQIILRARGRGANTINAELQREGFPPEQW